MTTSPSEDIADEIVQAGDVLEDAAEQWLSTRSGADAERSIEQTWSDLAELGWFHIVAAENEDGLALPPETLSGLARATGRHLLKGPVLEHVFVAPWLLDQLDSDDARRILRPTLMGRQRLALAEPRFAPHHHNPPCVDEQGQISGIVRLVPHAADADVLIVITTGPNPQLHLLDTEAAGVSIRPREPLSAMHPVADVHLTQAPAVTVNVSVAVLDEFYAWLRLLSAAWFTGVAEEVLRLTVSYVDNRIQFGRPVGSYQAVQHMAADMTVDVYAMINLVSFASTRTQGGGSRSASDESLAAKAFTAEKCLAVCESALQMHGGIGFTTDYPLHRFYTAALAMQSIYGHPEDLYLELGKLTLARNRSEKAES